MWRLIILTILIPLLIPAPAWQKPGLPFTTPTALKATPVQTMRVVGTPLPPDGTPVATPGGGRPTRIARGATVALTGQWQPAGYLVTWQADEPACVTMQQSAGVETLAGDCAASGDVLLIRGGSWAIAAIPGAMVRLRAADGLGLLGEMTIPPEYAAWLPLVAGP